MRERFRDGAGVLPTYEFEVNHYEEEQAQRTHGMRRTANTSGTGYVRQQGGKSPDILSFSGAILTQSQYDAMVDYFEACSTRTVFFREYTGEEREVIITSFAPRRIATAKNLREPSLMHYWRYSIEMEVVA